VPAWAHGTDGVGPRPCCPPTACRSGGCWWTATYTTSATTRTTRA